MPDDPIDLFASLRPEDDTLTAADREGIWAQVTGQLTAAGETDETLAVAQPRIAGRRRRMLSIAAAAVLVLAVLVVAARRDGREVRGGVEPSTIADGSGSTTLEPAAAPTEPTTTAVTSPGTVLPTAAASPFAGIVRQALPQSFDLASSSRASSLDAVALDNHGRLLVISVFVGQADAERAAAQANGLQVVDGVATGSDSEAVVTTSLGDAIRATCWFGQIPCDRQGAPAPPIDVRPIVTAVAGAITASNRDIVLASRTASDGAFEVDATRMLDSIDAALNQPGLASKATYTSGALAGPGPGRAWQIAADQGPQITIRALPLLGALRERTSSTAVSSSATVVGEGWVLVCTVIEPSGAGVPFNPEQLARVGRFGLSALAPVPAVNDLAGTGKLVLDPVPIGWSFVSGDERQTITNTRAIVRVYATTSSQPEQAPSLTLTAGDPPEGVSANAIDINGAKGELVNVGPRTRRISFGPVAGLWATLDATGIDDNALIGIAKTVGAAADGGGLAISPASLPAGVAERAAGYRSDRGLVPFAALASPIPSGLWTSQHTYARYWSMRSTADTLPLYRIRLDDVHDVTVHGHAGFGGKTGGYTLVGWAEGDRIYLVESNTTDGAGTGLGPEDLASDANRLRPATIAEWSAFSAPPAPNDPTASTTTAPKG